jgi:hypothetical protein
MPESELSLKIPRMECDNLLALASPTAPRGFHVRQAFQPD